MPAHMGVWVGCSRDTEFCTLGQIGFWLFSLVTGVCLLFYDALHLGLKMVS